MDTQLHTIFLFKLFTIPFLIAVVAYVQNRWGHGMGGVASGLPLLAGPISIFLAIEQGLPFARSAGPETLAAFLGTSAYAVTYTTLAKTRPWFICWIFGIVACLSVFYIQSLVSLPPLANLALGALSAAINTIFVSRIPPKPQVHPEGKFWDVFIDAIAVLVPLLLITRLAHILGPKYSGILSSFPVFWTVLFISTQIQWGYDALINFFRGAVVGNYSTIVFFSIIIFVPTDNIAALYILATFLAAVAAYFIQRNQAFFLKKRF